MLVQTRRRDESKKEKKSQDHKNRIVSVRHRPDKKEDMDSRDPTHDAKERLGVRFEMDCKGDIWSTSVQLLKSLDAIDPVILGILE